MLKYTSSRPSLTSAVLVAFLVGAAMALFRAWLVMLLLGAAHSHEASIPAWGFAAVLPLVIAVGVATHEGTSD